ncbi:ATP-binding protein [Niallia sp. 01092]|uniref:ATP-binding protein n=1 Tax=unclassified Niallia TaxID=2837522 RepID=UPI003FD5B5DE
MKMKKKQILQYILIAVVPVFIAAFFYIDKIIQEEWEQRKNHASWIGTTHQKHWDAFISKTVTSLNILSISIETYENSIENTESLLQNVLKQEPTYGGLILLDQAGNKITGTVNHVHSFAKTDYINEVIQTKDSVISNKQQMLSNGQKVVGLAKPILNKQKELKYILVVYLRIDYLLNIMEILTPDENIAILNANQDIIISLNSYIASNKKTVTLPIDALPWKIQVEVKEINKATIIKKSIAFILFCFVCSHLVYLLLQFYLLRQKTELEKKQNELQKLELVGNLAASSAHEIRNPLTGIKGLIQLLSEKHTTKEEQFYFSIIQTEITRINEIVSQFLILGKPTAFKKQLIDLQTILAELKPLIISESNFHNVQYSFQIPERNIPIICAADQMKQVILNITKNAFEAMVDGGILRLNVIISYDKVIITILDNGVGISNAQLKKVFQPFYTSKDTGTGLGLIVCKRIIQSFNGEIFITSKKNEGTKVDIILPLAE